MHTARASQQGFTLMEMVVVVGIMAVLGGALLSTYGGSGQGSVSQNSQVQAARYEMQQIRRALLRFKQDNPDVDDVISDIIDARRSPADFDFLFTQGSVSNWNIHYQTGWRGPYINGGDGGLVDTGDNLEPEGTGQSHIVTIIPTTDIATPITLQRGIPDPFALPDISNNDDAFPLVDSCQENIANNNCLFDWRLVGENDSHTPHLKFGRPYLLFDFNSSTKARLVSMGPNGKYEGAAITSACGASLLATGDDLVTCLY
ncbi:MAG: type II secretion system protein [Bermanella sp.]